MKRILSVTLVLSLLVTILLGMSTAASAASGSWGSLSWSVSGETLTISGYGEMKEASSNSYPWYGYRNSIRAIVIKEGVTYIAPYAFFMYGSYTNWRVELPLSLRGVGHRAFYSWSYNPNIYYAGSLEDRKALLSWGEWNHGLANGTWHYSAHSHQWTLKSTTAATCTANGTKTYSCHCGQTKQDTISMLGHNYSGKPSYNWTQTNNGYSVTATIYCSRNSSHYINETVQATYQQLSEPNCTAKGEGKYTASFSNTLFSTQTKTVAILEFGHSYTSVVTKPTCTEKGYTTYTCHCQYSYVDNYVEPIEHPWEYTGVTKQPTCKEEGEKTFTCPKCNATKTEPIPKTDDHIYGNWEKADDNIHKHICTVCEKVETGNHTWDSGKITKQPTCTVQGEKTYTCQDCQGTKIELLPVVPHSYGKWVYADTAVHKHTCSGCGGAETEKHDWNSGKVTKAPTCKEEGEKTFTCLVCAGTKVEPIAKLTVHTYDNDCDTICNICEAVRTVNHNYESSWSKDETYHWIECAECGHKKDEASHTPGAPATETTPQTCTVCDYIINPVIDHVHKFDTEWKTDKNGHWHVCSGCEQKDSYGAHKFENACDPDCETCGYERKITHSFTVEYLSDDTNHWHACSVCGEKKDINVHEPGPEATETTAQVCTICDYEIVPAFGVTEETEATVESIEETEGTVPTEEMSDGDDHQNGFPWWIIILVACVGVAAAVILVVVKKKKDQ